MFTANIVGRSSKTDMSETFYELGDAWGYVLSFLTHPSNGCDQYDRGYINGMRDAGYVGTIYTQKYTIAVSSS